MKIQKVTSKNISITKKKEKRKSNKSYMVCTNKEHLHTKFTTDIDFTDEPVVQYNLPVVGDTFVDDCKQIIKAIINTNKI